MSEWVKEVPSVRQQYNLLSRIWGRDVEPGYVFLPWIPKEFAGDEKKRKLNFHNGPPFNWPPQDGGAAIKAHLSQHQNDEFYFTPATFYEPQRRSDAIALERALWADLDEANPRQITPTPTIAWESSPGRYQAVWLFTSGAPGGLGGVTDPGGINHRLTYMIGADGSGWDATQLLRIPGTKNNKPQFGEKGAQGYLLFAESTPRPNWDDFKDLPEVPRALVPMEYDVLELFLERLDPKEILARVQRKLPRYVRELLKAKDTGDHNRSDIAWQIERELSDAGCSLEEIVCVVRNSIWNKYIGRADELKRLQVEAQKAISMRVHKDLETLEIVPKEWNEWQEFSDWYWADQPKIEWLIPNYWPKGGLGFIAGVPKSYKSWMGLHLALAVATGGEFLGQRAKQGRVLYIQEEDSEVTVRSRVQSMIEDVCPPEFQVHGHMELTDSGVVWNPPQFPLLQMRIQSSFTISDPDWMGKLEEFVTEHHIDLVVLDTLMTVSGDVDVDKAKEVRIEILNPLKEMARTLDLAVCFIHHFIKDNKQPVLKPGETPTTRTSVRMMGSGQFHAWADCGIYVAAKTDNDLFIEIENKFRQTENLHLKLEQPLIPRRDKMMTWKPKIWVDLPVSEEKKEANAVGQVEKRKMNNGRLPQSYYDLKLMNAIGPKRARTLEDLAKVWQKHITNCKRFLDTGMKYGYVAQTDDGRYYAIET